MTGYAMESPRPVSEVLLPGFTAGPGTLLHHSEALADVPGRRMMTYAIPVRGHGQVTWRQVHDRDTS